MIPDYEETPTIPKRRIEIKIVDDSAPPTQSTSTLEPAQSSSLLRASTSVGSCLVSSGSSSSLAVASSQRKSRPSIVSSLAQHQIRRRESTMSLFSLNASSEQKRIGIDYLNKLYEEKVRDQDEYTSLLRESSKLVAAQKASGGGQSSSVNRTPSGSFCFVSQEANCIRRLSANTPTLAKSTSQLLAKEEIFLARRRAAEQLEGRNSKDASAMSSGKFSGLFGTFLFALNILVVLLVRAGFVSKRVVVNVRNNLKIYLFILVLFSVISTACLFSFLKLFNKIKAGKVAV